MFTWALEFLAGVTVLVIYVVLGPGIGGILLSTDYGRILELVFLCLWGIIIPSSYILKTEEVKNKIINNPMVYPFRNILQVLNARITPVVELEMGANQQPVNNIRHQPIPTISANVRIAEQ